MAEHGQGWAALVRREEGHRQKPSRALSRAGQLCGLGPAEGTVSVALPGCSLEEVETRAGDGPGRRGAVEVVSRMSMGEDKSQVSGPLEICGEVPQRGEEDTAGGRGWGGCAFLGAGRGGFRGGAEQRPGRGGLGASRGHLARPRLVVGGDWPVGGLQSWREVRSENPPCCLGSFHEPHALPSPSAGQ